MASQAPDHPPAAAAAPFDDDPDLDDTDDSDEDDEEKPPPPPPRPTAADQDPAPTPALPLAAAAPAVSERRRRRAVEERKPSPFEDSRRLFQRLWTDEDEIKILTGFLEFTSSRGTTHASHQYDTGPFYDQIRKQLQLDFTKSQLIEKLRRLKKKYRTAANRIDSSSKEFVFKSPHDKATYEIAKKIWSASFKRSRDSEDENEEDDLNPNHHSSDANNDPTAVVVPRSRRRGRKRSFVPEPPATIIKEEDEPAAAPITTPIAVPAPAQPPPPNIIEETVKSCLSPLFKELLWPFGGLPANSLLGLGGGEGMGSDEKWRKQRILELEVYLKRTELVRDQIKSALEELRKSTLEELRAEVTDS